MKSSDQVRTSVSRAYTRAARAAAASGGGCGCCSGPAASSETASLAGYREEELASLPQDAVVTSFGCGDPLSFAAVRQGDVVVDLGSGAGIDILLAARRAGPGGRVIGIDMTDEMIEKARRNIAASGFTNVEVRKGIIEDLPVESGSVDWVISNCVINLSPEKPRVFAEIARILAPGGQFLISDIMVQDLPEELRRNEAIYHGCVGGAISEAEYVGGLRAAGLTGIEIRKRHVYDAAQIGYLIGAGLHGEDGGSCCGVAGEGSSDAGEVGHSLAGKIWSAQVYGRK